MPECVAGVIADNGASRLFAHLRDRDISLGLYLAVTGQRVTGRNLMRYGISTHFVPSQLIAPMKEALMKEIK